MAAGVKYGPEVFKPEEDRPSNFCNLINLDYGYSPVEEELRMLQLILNHQRTFKKLISPYEILSFPISDIGHIFLNMEDFIHIYDLQTICYMDSIFFNLYAKAKHNTRFIYLNICINTRCDEEVGVGAIMYSFSPTIFIHAIAVQHPSDPTFEALENDEGVPFILPAKSSLQAEVFNYFCCQVRQPTDERPKGICINGVFECQAALDAARDGSNPNSGLYMLNLIRTSVIYDQVAWSRYFFRPLQYKIRHDHSRKRDKKE